jgi:glutamyl-tRNA synthetase
LFWAQITDKLLIMSKPKVRVRFAPSPTGLLHLGGIRSALFNWLYAQKEAGTYMLRMEDTDRERYVDEAVQQIKESHDWLGLTPDEFTTQSERLDVYKKYADELVAKGALYPCWCSPERLTTLREKAQAEHKAFKYDRHCLDNPGDPSQPHVLRFKIPEQPEVISWKDAVRDELSFKRSEQDDFVALKSDGYPTYNFANVVDDHTMEISHVLRAEEFLPSTPKHILLYQAFDWEAPVFAHLPQVFGSDGSKLSKRHGAKSVLEYRDAGYLPDAVINFMAGLGWNAGEGSTKEIYTREELIKAFSLERIQKSPAVFDEERLNWLNGIYIRSLSLDELHKHAQGFWPTGANKTSSEYQKAVLGLVQERLKYLSELPELTDFFFIDPKASGLTQLKNEQAAEYLAKANELLSTCEFDHDSLEQALRKLAEDLDVKPGTLFQTLRIAITGKTAAPGIFETLSVLGKETVLRRLKTAL